MRDAIGHVGTSGKSVAGQKRARDIRHTLSLTTILLVLVLAGCGGKEKRSCTLSGFRATPSSPLAACKAETTILSADFNGDGRPDLAIPESSRNPCAVGAGNNEITVLLGDGRGGFETAPGSQVKFPASSLPDYTYPMFARAFLPAPIEMVIGDWNADGIPDIADVGGWPDDIIAVLGDGDGRFEKAQSAFSGKKRLANEESRAYGVNPPAFPAVGDFNDDGIADIAAGYPVEFSTPLFVVPEMTVQASAILILLNDDKEGFKAVPDSPLKADKLAALAVGYLDGDKHQDLALPDQANGVVVLLGDGEGRFDAASGSPFAAGSAPSAIAIDDLDGDNHRDIVVANSGSNDVTALLGDGAGDFRVAPSSPFRVGGAPQSIALADFNGDGLLDIATADYLANGVSVLLGNGKGGFRKAPGSPYAIDTAPKPVGIANAPTGLQNLVAADFDGNGRDDLAVAGFQRSGVTVLLGRCR